MKIIRIDRQKNLSQQVDTIELVITDQEYTITEKFGRLHIHATGRINIEPCVSNEIIISSEER